MRNHLGNLSVIMCVCVCVYVCEADAGTAWHAS